MTMYAQQDGNAARAQVERVTLRPPLAMLWRQVRAFGNPIIGPPIIFNSHAGRRDRLRACSWDGSELWTADHGPSGEILIAGGRLITSVSRRNRVEMLACELGTGKEVARIEGGDIEGLVNRRDFAFCHDGRESILGVARAPSMTRIWTVKADDVGSGGRWETECAADEGRVFVGKDHELVCLEAATGKLVWVAGLSELGGKVGPGQWQPMVSKGVVVIRVGNGTAGFDVRTGRVRWLVPRAGASHIYRGELCISGWDGSFGTYDVRSGRPRMEVDLVSRMRTILKGASRITTCIVASDTHVFGGEQGGRIWAWERRTGEPVWYMQVPEAKDFIGVQPVIADGRLLIASWTLDQTPTALYCFEQVGAAKRQGTGRQVRNVVDGRKARRSRG